jgi:hypothetical protein
VNEYLELAGLLAYCTFGFLPILQQWFFPSSCVKIKHKINLQLRG